MKRKTAEHRSDPLLIQACIEGDPGAWNRLVAQYKRLVYSIPLDYRMSHDEADDVFQNVFVIVYKKLASLRDPGRFSAWLITTTHRECWRHQRARGPQASDDVILVDESPAPDAIERWEREQTVRALLEQLGSPCQELLTALFLDSSEPSYQKISEQLGLPVGSIGPTRARCFQKLEKLMDATGVEFP